MSSIFGKNYIRKQESKTKRKNHRHGDIESHEDVTINEKNTRKTKSKRKEYDDHHGHGRDAMKKAKHHRDDNKFTESDSDVSVRDKISSITRESRYRKYRLITAVSCVVIISIIFGVLIFLLIYYYPRNKNNSPTPSPVNPPTQSCQITPPWGQQDGVYLYNTFSRGYYDINVGSYVYPCVKNNGQQIIYVDTCNPFVLIYNRNENCDQCFQYCNGENLAPVYPGANYCAPSGFQLQATGEYSVQLKYARYCQSNYFSSCDYVSTAGSVSFCVI